MTGEKHSIYRQGLALLFSISIFLLCIFTLEKTGVPRGYSMTLTAVALIVLWSIVSFPGATTSARKFFSTANSTRSTVNALAMTSGLSFPVLIGSGGGVLFVNPAFFIAIVLGTTIGVAISSMVVSRRFYETGASDIGDLLVKQYQTPLLARCVSMILLISGIGLCAIGVYHASMLTSWFFSLSYNATFVMMLAVTMLAVLLGGMNSITRLAAVGALLLIVGINFPLVLESLSQNGFPLGQITFGNSALVDMWDLEDQLKSLGIPLLGDIVSVTSPLAMWSGGELVAVGLVIAVSVAFFPASSHQYAATQTLQLTTRSSTKLILSIGFIGISLFSFLIFSKFSIYQTTLGLTLSEARIAAPFVYSWGERSFDLITLCGQAISNEAELLTACGDGAEHVMGMQDLQFNGDLLLAASPDLLGLPFAFTALLTCSIILVLISFSAMTLLATSNIFVSAFFSQLTLHVASAKIFISRLTIIIIGALVGGLVMFYTFDTLSVFMFSMSLIATICCPALLGALWLKQTSATVVLSSTALGLVIMGLYFIQSKYGVDFASNTGDELNIVLPGMATIIPPELGAIFSVPASLLVLYGNTIYSDVLKPKRSATE